METIRKTEKKYGTRALTIAIVVCFFCISIDQVAIGKGLILGSLFSILNFVLMGETVPYKILKSKKRTFFLSLGSIYFRYMILAIPLIIAIKLETFNLFAVIIGIFAVQIVLLGEYLYTFIATVRRKRI